MERCGEEARVAERADDVREERRGTGRGGGTGGGGGAVCWAEGLRAVPARCFWEVDGGRGGGDGDVDVGGVEEEELGLGGCGAVAAARGDGGVRRARARMGGGACALVAHEVELELGGDVVADEVLWRRGQRGCRRDSDVQDARRRSRPPPS